VTDSGFKAEINSVNLADIVQLACLEGKNRCLEVHSGDKTGRVFFAKGEIVHASTGELTGTDAFFEIMTWPGGNLTLFSDETDVISIDVSWNFLLIEALRKIDEAGGMAAEEAKLPEILIVDDSSVISKVLKKLFTENLNVDVAGEAPNGKEAIKFMESHSPDLITLDINMPVMSGDVTIKHIMIKSPAPVVLISGINEDSYARVMDFVRLGAVDAISKPSLGESWDSVETRLSEIIGKLPELNIKNIRRARNPVRAKEKICPVFPATKLLIIIGGMGGMLELNKIMPAINLDGETGIVIFQDIAPGLSRFFASYMDNFTSYLTVSMEQRNVLMGCQCLVGKWQGVWEIKRCTDGEYELVCTDNGSFDIDTMLITAAEFFGSSLRVMVLSGSDVDMEIGLESVSSKGGTVVIQTPETCLHPAPLVKMKAMELEDRCIDIEKFSEEFSDFLSK
jgi:two-component system chemotaxis response regulator CheB